MVSVFLLCSVTLKLPVFLGQLFCSIMLLCYRYVLSQKCRGGQATFCLALGQRNGASETRKSSDAEPDLFIFGSGSTFVHNFGSDSGFCSSSCYIFFDC